MHSHTYVYIVFNVFKRGNTKSFIITVSQQFPTVLSVYSRVTVEYLNFITFTCAECTYLCTLLA